MELNLTEHLARIQKELKAPKGQFNKFGNYKYRSCEDILEAVKPLLEPCALTLDDDIVSIGSRIYVKATATLRLGSHTLSSSAFAREEENKKGMDSAQLTGSCSSYARKYALNGLFCIDDTKDSDSTNDHGKRDLGNKGNVIANLPDEFDIDKDKFEKSMRVGAYVIPMGKFKGKTFEQVDPEELKGFCTWLSKQEKQSQQAVDFLNKARDFFRGQHGA